MEGFGIYLFVIAHYSIQGNRWGHGLYLFPILIDMRKIIINSVVFLLIFICWNIYLKNTSSFYTQEKEYQKNIDLSLASKSEIILLGDSHLASLKKVTLNKAIGNLAYGADGIKEMYAKSLIEIRNNPELKYVFLSTEPQMFNAGNSPNGTFLDKYIFDLKEARQLYDKNRLEVTTDYVPLFNNDYLNFFRNKLYTTLKGTTVDTEQKAWENLTTKEKNEMSEKLGISDHASIMEQPQDTIYFKKMMGLFKEHNIKVISIKFPVTSKYIGQCSRDDVAKVNRFLSKFDFYAQLDYTHSIDSLNFFEDPDHLGKKGVEKIAHTIENDTELSIMER